MQYRKLGRTGFPVSDIGYGAWGIGGKQWLGGSDDESLRALRRAIQLGVNLIDTALAYGEGHSEVLVSQVVRESQQKIYVATKVPPKNRTWPAQKGTPIAEVFPYDYIMGCAEESLANLKLDSIDLLQLHVWNPEWIDADDWRRAFGDLKRAGKIRAAGISLTEHDPDSGLEAVRSGVIDVVQVIYNIFDQLPGKNLFPLCQREDVGVLARVPLDEGSLTDRFGVNTTFPPGDFRDWYFRGDRKQETAAHLTPLKRDLAGANLAETALRFCLSHPAVSSVIPGMRTVRHAESNTALSDQGPLGPEMIATLRRHAWDRNYYQ